MIRSNIIYKKESNIGMQYSQFPHRHSIQQSLFLPPKNIPNKIPDYVPQWLLIRYQDQSFIRVSTLPQNKDKHLKLWYKIIKKLGFIYPQSTLLLVWNLLVSVAIVLNYYQIPVAMFFTSAVYYSQFQSGVSLALNTLFTTCIFINILFIRPLTAYYDSGRLITTRKILLNHYLKLQFWLNIISWLSLIIYIFSNDPHLVYLKLLFYLSIVSLYQMDKLILYKVEFWRVRSAVYKLFRLICMLLFVLFWIASVFFAIDYKYYLEQNQYYPVNLWLTNSVALQYSDQSYIDIPKMYQWPVWLNYSMYWVLQTVTGVGYGDLTPRNPVQVAYCDVVIVTFCLFYALFVNSVWQILVELLGSQRSYKKEILKYYQRNYQLDSQMVVKLENYIYETAQAQEKQQKEKSINQNLSDQLSNQLLLARQKKLFIGISFFSKLTSSLSESYAQFLYGLARSTKDVRYGQGQIILSAGVLDEKVCLLAVGQVKLSYQNTKLMKIVENSDKINFFGVFNFICRTKSNYSAQAIKYSKVSQLTRKQFTNSTKLHQKIHQKTQQLYQNIKFYNLHELSSQTCWTCSSQTNNNHATHNCPEYFQWVTLYRDPVQIQSQRLMRRLGYTFRSFCYRRSRKSMKIHIKNNKNNIILLDEQQKTQTKNLPQFKDQLQLRNKNFVDQVRNYTEYRKISNL